MSHGPGVISIHIDDWQNNGLRAEILGLLRHSDQRLVGVARDVDGQVLLSIEEGANCRDCGMPVTPATFDLGTAQAVAAHCSRCGQTYTGERSMPRRSPLSVRSEGHPQPLTVVSPAAAAG